MTDFTTDQKIKLMELAVQLTIKIGAADRLIKHYDEMVKAIEGLEPPTIPQTQEEYDEKQRHG